MTDLDFLKYTAPNIVQYFHPTDEFMNYWEHFVVDKFVIECGAGECEFSKLMHQSGMKCMAIEPRASDQVRQDCFNFLLPATVQETVLLNQCPAIVVAARPDHSGWFEELPSLIHSDSELYYIGLEKNFDIDFDPEWNFDIVRSNCGRDGEMLVKICVE